MNTPGPYATIIEICQSKEANEAFFKTYLYVFDYGDKMSDIEAAALRERLKQSTKAKRMIHFYSKEAFDNYRKETENE